MKKSCPKCNKLFTSATYKYCYECNIANKSTDETDDKVMMILINTIHILKRKYLKQFVIVYGGFTLKIN